MTAEVRVGLMTLCFNKLPADGTLVPKHVGVDIKYELCFVMFYCILINAFFG
jgi:hypothetical protein